MRTFIPKKRTDKRAAVRSYFCPTCNVRTGAHFPTHYGLRMHLWRVHKIGREL